MDWTTQRRFSTSTSKHHNLTVVAENNRKKLTILNLKTYSKMTDDTESNRYYDNHDLVLKRIRDGTLDNNDFWFIDRWGHAEFKLILQELQKYPQNVTSVYLSWGWRDGEHRKRSSQDFVELFEVLEFKITTDSCERLFRVNGILMVYKTKRDEESSNVTFTNRRWITQGRSVPEQGQN